MAAIDDLNAAVSKLAADVAAFVASHPSGGASDAQLQQVQAAVAAIDAQVAPPPAP